MPDACQDACSGLTCADYAHETCELARLVGCLCAGCVNLAALDHTCPICRSSVYDALRVWDP